MSSVCQETAQCIEMGLSLTIDESQVCFIHIGVCVCVSLSYCDGGCCGSCYCYGCYGGDCCYGYSYGCSSGCCYSVVVAAIVITVVVVVMVGGMLLWLL